MRRLRGPAASALSRRHAVQIGRHRDWRRRASFQHCRYGPCERWRWRIRHGRAAIRRGRNTPDDIAEIEGLRDRRCFGRRSWSDAPTARRDTDLAGGTYGTVCHRPYIDQTGAAVLPKNIVGAVAEIVAGAGDLPARRREPDLA